MSRTTKLLLCLTVFYALGYVTVSSSNEGMAFWFQTLPLPSWTLPTALFAPIWMMLHWVMGYVFWCVWTGSGRESVQLPRARALSLASSILIAQVLVALWAWMFYRSHLVLASLAVLVIAHVLLITSAVLDKRVLLLLPISWILYLEILQIVISRG